MKQVVEDAGRGDDCAIEGRDRPRAEGAAEQGPERAQLGGTERAPRRGEGLNSIDRFVPDIVPDLGEPIGYSNA